MKDPTPGCWLVLLSIRSWAKLFRGLADEAAPASVPNRLLAEVSGPVEVPVPLDVPLIFDVVPRFAFNRSVPSAAPWLCLFRMSWFIWDWKFDRLFKRSFPA